MVSPFEELSPYVPKNQVLREDFDKCITTLDKSKNDQFFRRMLFRSAFAYIEGMIFQFKQSTAGLLLVKHIAAIQRDQDNIFLPTPYTGFLNDSDFTLTENGDIKEKRAFIHLKTNIQYAFKVASEVYFSSYKLDKGSGWLCFLRSVKVRNRITHPKDPVEMIISDNEVADVKATLIWFDSTFEDLFEQVDFKKFLTSLQGPNTSDA